MKFARHPDQPTAQDIRLIDGVFLKEMHFRHAGMAFPQHSHEYAHISYIAAGAVRVYADDALMGEFVAPVPIVIAARVKHRFETLLPGTTILCIHNADRAEAGEDVATHEEHHLEALET